MRNGAYRMGWLWLPCYTLVLRMDPYQHQALELLRAILFVVLLVLTEVFHA